MPKNPPENPSEEESSKPDDLDNLFGEAVNVPEEKEKGEEDKSKGDGKKKNVAIPKSVADEGIMCNVRLSLHTLSLYKIANQSSVDITGLPLSLGDFLDDCVEDFYQGRGLALGLINLGAGGGNDNQ